jgi:hypothetical protein
LARQLVEQIEITQIDADKRREVALEALLQDNNGSPVYEQVESLDDEEYMVVADGSLRALIEAARLEDLGDQLQEVEGELWVMLMGRKVTVRAIDPNDRPIQCKMYSVSVLDNNTGRTLDGRSVNHFTGHVIKVCAQDNVLRIRNRNPMKKFIPAAFNDDRFYETPILGEDGTPIVDIFFEEG